MERSQTEYVAICRCWPTRKWLGLSIRHQTEKASYRQSGDTAVWRANRAARNKRAIVHRWHVRDKLLEVDDLTWTQIITGVKIREKHNKGGKVQSNMKYTSLEEDFLNNRNYTAHQKLTVSRKSCSSKSMFRLC